MRETENLYASLSVGTPATAMGPNLRVKNLILVSKEGGRSPVAGTLTAVPQSWISRELEVGVLTAMPHACPAL